MNKTILFGSLITALVLSACERSEPPTKAPEEAVLASAEPQAAAPAPAPVATQTPPAASRSRDEPASVENHYSRAYATCLSTGGAAMGVTYDMAECTHAEIEHQDRLLNTSYQTAMRSLEPERAVKLRQAQRAWIKYRDSKCAAEASSGGTMDILNSGGCILSETVTRRLELEAMASFD